MIELSLDEAGDITLRAPGFEVFATWFDLIARGRPADANQNLAADCAVKPDAAGLAALFEDFGGLPETLASALLEHVGTPGGGAAEGYPCVRLVKAREAHTAHAAMAPGPAADVAGAALIPLDLLDACERVSRRAMIFTTPAGLLAFRPPARSDVADYVDALAAWKADKPDTSYLGAGRTLMLAAAISPDKIALAASIEAYPALAQWIPPVLHEASLGGKARPRS